MPVATAKAKKSVRAFAWPEGLGDALRVQPELSVSQFADRHRYLSEEYTAEPGPWQTERIPYARGMMDAFADLRVQSITIVKSARTGGTEVMNNCLLYNIGGDDPGPTLYVLPTLPDAKEEAEGRLKKLIENSSVAEKHIPRGVTTPHKPGWANGDRLLLRGPRTIYMAWAQAPRTLIRRTCMCVVFDEVDNCEKAAGALGNNLVLAAERTATYGPRGKVISATTPTTATAAAWTAWLASDQRRCYVPCPSCGGYQYLKFERIRRDEEILGNTDEISLPALADRIESRGAVYYECEHCEARIPQRWKKWMVDRYVWVRDGEHIADKHPGANYNQNYNPEILGEPSVIGRVGFHIWSAYSPWRTWAQILAQWFRVYRDHDKRRVFVNQWLGLPYEEEETNPNPDILPERRRHSYPRGICPGGVEALVAYADVQKDHMYYVIRGWGLYESSWLIQEGIVEDWEGLKAITHAYYRREDGTRLRPLVCGIDSGDGARTNEIYDVCKRTAGFLPTKGVVNVGYAWKPSKVDYGQVPGGGAKNKAGEIILYLINTEYWKTKLHRMIAQIPEGDPGFWAIHGEVGQDFLDHMTAEHRVWQVKKNSGRRELVWVLKTAGRPNHYLDCEVGAMMMADHKQLLNLSESSIPASAAPSSDSQPPTQPPKWGRAPMGWNRSK